MSPKEKRYWLLVGAVTLVIFSTLFLGRPLQRLLSSQDIQAGIFLLGMALTGGAMVLHAFKVKPAKGQLAVWFGLSAVLIMFMLRLGLAERTHLIEYGVLTILIHRALLIRSGTGNSIAPAVMAFILASLIGLVDEGLQYFLPNRVFDPQDILFNCLASMMAVAGSSMIAWTSKKYGPRH